MLDLSIVLPTCNRAPLLAQALRSLRDSIRCAHEIIVVDGASTDATPDVLSDAQRQMGDRLRVIREEQREGFVKGTNKGFRAAVGRNLTWLNDDARPLPGTLDSAVEQIDQHGTEVAFVAMFHRWHSMWNIAYESFLRGRAYRLCHVRGTLYANFPVGKRATYERLGFFDENYFVCAADPDLSLKAWNAGMSVVPAFGTFVDHDETFDDRRKEDSTAAQEDNRKLFEKWSLPPRNPMRNDFDPKRPCTLQNRRTFVAAVA